MILPNVRLGLRHVSNHVSRKHARRQPPQRKMSPLRWMRPNSHYYGRLLCSKAAGRSRGRNAWMCRSIGCD